MTEPPSANISVGPAITCIASIDAALNAYLGGNLSDHPEKLH
jgi:hypothetical protein